MGPDPVHCLLEVVRVGELPENTRGRRVRRGLETYTKIQGLRGNFETKYVRKQPCGPYLIGGTCGIYCRER
jgi:hypothetical protein